MPSPRRLRRVVTGLRPHAMVAATPGPYGLLGARYGRALGARCLAGMHTDLSALSTLYSGRVVARVNRWGLTAAQKRLFRRCDRVVANAPHMVTAAERMGCARPAIVGTQVPPRCLTEPTGPARSRVERVLFVGRLADEKCVDEVLAAAPATPIATSA